MEFVEGVDPASLSGLRCIAESEQFCVYPEGSDTYLIVQRHEGTPWTALRISGDGLFRVGLLLIQAMRHLYRDMAGDLSPNKRGAQESVR
jgi:hypothetical protein